jgi:hypothetical protein
MDSLNPLAEEQIDHLINPQSGLTPTERLVMLLLQAQPSTFNRLCQQTGSNTGTVRYAIRCLLLSGLIELINNNNKTVAGERTYAITGMNGAL